MIHEKMPKNTNLKLPPASDARRFLVSGFNEGELGDD